MSLALEMKTFCECEWFISESRVSQIAEFRNFGNGVTYIQISTLRLLVNSLSIYLLF